VRATAWLGGNPGLESENISPFETVGHAKSRQLSLRDPQLVTLIQQYYHHHQHIINSSWHEPQAADHLEPGAK
jgi:hypothetical protein